eukprot:TRINITY_DN7683_c0_g1_i1.p1 TRINITY_DN7683_c0_g1~~TRINITY_DN7683_c0_g1_i1.p1  ORF type:complete len:594 (-),score=101.87 TRINITY_DN7683_c0_g1_i1:55-1803(-)
MTTFEALEAHPLHDGGDFLGSPQSRSQKLNFVSPKLKLDEFFIGWLCHAETQTNIANLIKDLRAGIPLNRSQYAVYRTTPSPLSPPSALGVAPPRSPIVSPCTSPTLGEKPDRSPPQQVVKAFAEVLLDSRPTHPKPLRGTLSPRRTTSPPPQPLVSKQLNIPPFFANKKADLQRQVAAVLQQRKARLQELFAGHAAGLRPEEFANVTKQIAGLPGWFNHTLFQRLDKRNLGLVKKDAFEQWWTGEHQAHTIAARVFAFLKQPDSQFIVKSDFKEVVRELIDFHPGLDFLKATPEFQDKYAETVVIRIMYTVNRSGSGRLSLKELQSSDLCEVMLQLDDEPDINKVTRFFSYEHFYVLYCKFWELDADHDYYIDRADLLRHNNQALTEKIVDRIFSGAPHKISSDRENFMNYEDFCWFLLSEEDKMSDTALEYWFRCIDMDADGVISGWEMEYFYLEQLQRMECMQMEAVSFMDITCQMLDMIKPQDITRVTLRDLKACQMAGNFFNVLFNLQKFTQMEQKDPFLARGDNDECDWDRYARAEYDRLSAEEDPGVDQDDMADEMSWGSYSSATAGRGTMEAPF